MSIIAGLFVLLITSRLSNQLFFDNLFSADAVETLINDLGLDFWGAEMDKVWELPPKENNRVNKYVNKIANHSKLDTLPI